jgi:ligand-binding sensor protein
MDEFNKLAHIPMAVIDVRGKVLVGVGWQDICTRFHRAHPESCKHCLESDTCLSAGVPAGEIKLYKCKNNMWDVATPILVGGHHLGSVFMGQFFFEDEPLDYGVFRAQAAHFGFDEVAYLAALDAVPRLSREAVAAAMA